MAAQRVGAHRIEHAPSVLGEAPGRLAAAVPSAASAAASTRRWDGRPPGAHGSPRRDIESRPLILCARCRWSWWRWCRSALLVRAEAPSPSPTRAIGCEPCPLEPPPLPPPAAADDPTLPAPAGRSRRATRTTRSTPGSMRSGTPSRARWSWNGGTRRARPRARFPFHLYWNAYPQHALDVRARRGPARGRAHHARRRRHARLRLHPGRRPSGRSKTAGEIDLTPTLRYVQPDDGNADDRTVAGDHARPGRARGHHAVQDRLDRADAVRRRRPLGLGPRLPLRRPVVPQDRGLLEGRLERASVPSLQRVLLRLRRLRRPAHRAPGVRPRRHRGPAGRHRQPRRHAHLPLPPGGRARLRLGDEPAPAARLARASTSPATRRWTSACSSSPSTAISPSATSKPPGSRCAATARGPRPYPYDQVTVVDPAWSSASGGMEYPTLFTGGAAMLRAARRCRAPRA